MDAILCKFKFDRHQVRHGIVQIVNLGLLLSSVLALWKVLMLVTGSPSPMVVVLTGSMEPGFCKGDILFLNMGKAPIRTGEIVVYHMEGRESKIPIVHRVIKVHERPEDSHADMMTKGDNNHPDDMFIYQEANRQWLHPQDVQGRVVGYLPKVGMMTILLNDYPALKFALLGGLAITVLLNKNDD